MGEPLPVESGSGSTWSDELYLRIVPRDHYLVRLNQLVDWESFVPIILPAYVRLAKASRFPYSPLTFVKMLVIAYLYSLAEKDAEELFDFYLPAKEFAGLAIGDPAPDHSMLSLFKHLLREADRWQYLEAFGNAVLRQAKEAHITFGRIVSRDGVHTIARRAGAPDDQQ